MYFGVELLFGRKFFPMSKKFKKRRKVKRFGILVISMPYNNGILNIKNNTTEIIIKMFVAP